MEVAKAALMKSSASPVQALTLVFHLGCDRNSFRSYSEETKSCCLLFLFESQAGFDLSD